MKKPWKNYKASKKHEKKLVKKQVKNIKKNT